MIVVSHREIDSRKFLSYLINSLQDLYQLNLISSIILFITLYQHFYGGGFFCYSWCSLSERIINYTVKFITEVRISRAFLTDARSHVILLLSRPQILICWRGRSFRRFFLRPSNEVLRQCSQWRDRVSVHCVSHAKTANNAASHWHTSLRTYVRASSKFYHIANCSIGQIYQFIQ